MSKYLKAQQLNRRVTFQRKAGGADEWGQPLDNWTDVFTCWAGIETISGVGFVNQEFIAADREVSRATASIRIRNRRVPPDATMRVLLLPKRTVYEIRVVLPDTRDNRFLNVGVAQGANDG